MDQPTSTPRFSIVIPAYNRPELVRLAIESVLAQTFSDYELIVVDDGSTDETLATLQAFGDRIVLLHQDNQGAEVARSNGAKLARGEYLVLLDHDDLLYPHALASYDRVIRAVPTPPLILGAMSYFSQFNDPRTSKPWGELVQYVQYPGFIAKNETSGVSCSCLVINAAVARKQGALRQQFTAFPFDGNDILLKLGTCEPCVFIKHPFTVAYRSHDANFSKRLDNLLESASCLAHYERLGQYPGGAARRFQRYAYIGGMCLTYISRGLQRGMVGLSLGLLLRTWPMVAAALINTARRRFRAPAPLITLPREN